MTDRQPATCSQPTRRVAFLGTPPAAATCLAALVEAGFEIPLVVTQPDRRRGRGSGLIPSPVKETAIAAGLPVGHDPRQVLDIDVDRAVVVAYGQILRSELLDRLEFVNVHFSLLPRWRGAAPVERAILAGDTVTGVCLMRITEGMDEGPVYDCRQVEIGENESARSLTDRLAVVGADLLVEALSRPLADPVPQSGTPTYAAKVDRSHNELDFALPAIELHRRVRIGRAWTTFRGDRLGVEETRVRPGDQERGAVRIVEERAPAGGGFEGGLGDFPVDGPVADLPVDGPVVDRHAVVVGTGDGLLELVAVKPAGRRSMTGLEWLNGVHLEPGEHLGR